MIATRPLDADFVQNHNIPALRDWSRARMFRRVSVTFRYRISGRERAREDPCSKFDCGFPRWARPTCRVATPAFLPKTRRRLQTAQRTRDCSRKERAGKRRDRETQFVLRPLFNLQIIAVSWGRRRRGPGACAFNHFASASANARLASMAGRAECAEAARANGVEDCSNGVRMARGISNRNPGVRNYRAGYFGGSRL